MQPSAWPLLCLDLLCSPPLCPARTGKKSTMQFHDSDILPFEYLDPLAWFEQLLFCLQRLYYSIHKSNYEWCTFEY